MNTKGAYRYPGSRPFEDTDIDRKLFFGRDREKEELLQKVLARRLVVLFAKSGLGKTSLINAGLNQLLRKNGCVPLKVRFNDVNMSPVQTVFAGIKKMAEQHHVDYEHGEENTLWQYFKTAAFWSPEDTLLTPVLILDQFEEFFAFHEPESRKTFVAQLADLVNGAIPAALRQSVEKGEAFPYTESPPNVKVLISIREDYLGQLEELSREISDILKNRFRLQALSREQAREAITKPSQVKDDKIQTPIFSYDSSTVKRMLVFLSVWMEKNKVVYKDEVESFQLQLLCQHIEEKVRRKTQEGDEIIIKEDDLSGMPGMQKVLQNFYDDRIKRLRGVRKKINVRKLCEKGLISLSDRRLSLEEEEIGRRFKVSPSLLAEMVDGRLLRAEKRVGSVYYELSHDTLVAPIRESQRKRRIGTSKIVGLVLIPVLIVIAIFYQSQMNKPQSKNESSRPSEAGDIKSTSKYKKATAIYSKITKYDQKNVEVYRELGDIFVKMALSDIKKGEPHKAIEVYRRASNFDVRYAGIYRRIAQVLKDRGEKNLIEELYGIASKVKSKDASYYIDLGFDYLELEKYDKAIESYKEARDIEPDNPKVYKGMGLVFRVMGDYDKAIENYQKAKEIDPKYTYYDNLIGELFYKIEKYDNAIEYFKKAIAHNPEHAKAYVNMGLVFYNKKKYKKSLEYYKKAIELNPKDSWPFNKTGLVFHAMRKYDKAIEYYKKAIELDPKYARAYNNIGNVFYEKQEYDRAIEYYKKVIDLKPNDAWPFNNMGVLFNAMRKYDKAIEYFKKAIENKPDYAYAYNNMGLAFSYKKEYDKAIGYYKKAIELNPKYAGAYFNMGNAFGNLKEYKKAIEVYKKAIESKPDYAMAYYNMGRVFHMMEKHDRALENYEKAMEIDPKYIWAKANLAHVSLIVEHFDKTSGLAIEILKEKDVITDIIVAMRFISIASLLLQGKDTNALDELQKFITFYHSLTSKYKSSYGYNDVKNFIRENKTLRAHYKTLLLKLIDIIESSKTEGDKKIKQLETMLKKKK